MGYLHNKVLAQNYSLKKYIYDYRKIKIVENSTVDKMLTMQAWEPGFESLAPKDRKEWQPPVAPTLLRQTGYLN